MSAAGRASNGLCKFEWRDDGFFSAPRDKYLAVKGVAGDIEVVAEVLRRSGVLRASRSVYRARPNSEVHDCRWSSEAAGDAGDVDSELQYQLGAGRPEGMALRLEAIARELPSSRDELERLAQARSSQLNRDAPQRHAHRLFIPPFNDEDDGAHGVRGSASRGWGLWTQWIDPTLIVTTPSRTWNDIDRNPRRGTVVSVAEWLRAAAESPGGIDKWVEKMFGKDPILLNHIDGPQARSMHW